MKLCFFDNPGQKLVNNFTKLSEIDFYIEYFTAGFLRLINKNVKVWHLGIPLRTRHQIQAFQEISRIFLIS